MINATKTLQLSIISCCKIPYCDLFLRYLVSRTFIRTNEIKYVCSMMHLHIFYYFCIARGSMAYIIIVIWLCKVY